MLDCGTGVHVKDTPFLIDCHMPLGTNPLFQGLF